MSKKRSKLAIIEAMLNTIRNTPKGEIKQTRLMYKANLSHTQMRTYIDELVSKNFITEVAREPYKFIIITDKGLNFLEDLIKMREFEKVFGL